MKIPQNIRIKVISEFYGDQKMNLKQVADENNLKISTCKAILKVYKKEGRIGKKKQREKKGTIIASINLVIKNNNMIEKIMYKYIFNQSFFLNSRIIGYYKR